MALRPLPKSVMSSAGPIPVRLVGKLTTPGNTTEALFGYFDPAKREILIEKGLALRVGWVTLWHERVHAALSDARVVFADKELEERVGDVIAALLVNDVP